MGSPKTTKEDKKEEVSLTQASAKQISMDVAVGAVLSELVGVFTFKQEQRAALKALLGEKDVFTVVLTGFSESEVKHCDTSRP